ncbi:guanine nucleotide-binding protein subunit alpha [Marasmius tenuissimus]|uniref:Guanine nucleotide-binding protein subunit alpha n=1 Tax=Marasmius tenuissimus TaxID=585030 RepID=A0ABR2ZPD5_9AGAR
MKYNGLATILVNLNSMLDLQRHLCDVLDCLWDSKTSKNAFKREAGEEASRKKLLELRADGYESYVAACSQAQTSRLLLSSPFILYLTLIAALGDSRHAHLILSEELDIVRFLRSIGLFDKDRTGTGVMAGRLLTQVIRLRLCPVADGLTGVVQDAISELSSTLEPGDLVTDHMWAQLEWGSADSPSREFLTNAVKIVQNELIRMDGTQASLNLYSDSHNMRDVKVLLLGEGCSGKTTIMKQLILSRHNSTSFTALCDPEYYLEMMEARLRAFLQRIMDWFLEDQCNSRWARHDAHTVGANFHKLPELDMSTRSQRLLELNDFVQVNITSAGDLCAVLASTSFAKLLDFPLDHYRSLLEALNDMAGRSRMHDDDTAHKSASLEPTNQNLLGWYIQTTEAHQESFTTKDSSYTFWDCGGQMSDRWVQYFPQTDVVLFVVSLIGYDQVSFENHSVYQDGMDRSLQLFSWICTASEDLMKRLRTCPLILVFNQMDLLADKLETSPLRNHFPDYDGGSDTNAACEYIKNHFLKHVQSGQNVSVFFMSAIDSKNVEDLFEKVHQLSRSITTKARRTARTSIIPASEAEISVLKFSLAEGFAVLNL